MSAQICPNPTSGAPCRQMFGRLVCHVDLLGRWATPIAIGWMLQVSHYHPLSSLSKYLPTLSGAQTCCVKMSCSDMTIAKGLGMSGCNGQVFPAFPSACGDTLRKISVVDTSVLKPGAYARLADDFAKALLEIQDAKEIAPAPAKVTATLLGTTVWWKLRSYCQACNSGMESTGHTLATPVGVSVLRCPCKSGFKTDRSWERRNVWSKSMAIWHTGYHSLHAARTRLGHSLTTWARRWSRLPFSSCLICLFSCLGSLGASAQDMHVFCFFQ